MSRKEAIITIVTFLTLLIGMSVLFIILPLSNYSEWERRYLAEKPEVSIEKLKNGTLAEETETYLADHFPFRDMFVTVYSFYETATGHKEIGGVYLGKDNFLFTKLTDDEIDPKDRKASADALVHFGQFLSEEEIPYRVMIVPSSGLSLKDKLPAGAPYYDQDAYLDNLAEQLGGSFTDTRAVLREESDYYRTDHHWTMSGAYKAYEVWERSMGRTPVSKDRFRSVTVSDRFLGTLYAKAKPVRYQSDTVTALEPEGVAVTVTADGKTLAGLYDETKLNSRYDAYSYFLGGNYGELKITGTGPQGSRLLVIKDSYANCFLPLLVTEYEEIHVLDLRYFGRPVRDYVKANAISEVLVLYGADGFACERSIRKLER
ncbi:MAG: hypothetical protein J5643_02855 [Lachnospiraceae bacterium]|nr:hypothetical protein [Lachnospiraceae bacterium]